jgi:hypothetical protein
MAWLLFVPASKKCVYVFFNGDGASKDPRRCFIKTMSVAQLHKGPYKNKKLQPSLVKVQNEPQF